MEEILINREELLTKLKENRDRHINIWRDAMGVWKEKVVKALSKSLRDAKKGIAWNANFNLPKPLEFSEKYAEAIAQVEWHAKDIIKLDDHEFNQLVLDKWEWSSSFSSSSESYGPSVSSR